MIRVARVSEEIAHRDQNGATLDLVGRRLKIAQQDYAARYGKAKR
jgi:hypothetical protein